MSDKTTRRELEMRAKEIEYSLLTKHPEKLLSKILKETKIEQLPTQNKPKT